MRDALIPCFARRASLFRAALLLAATLASLASASGPSSAEEERAEDALGPVYEALFAGEAGRALALLEGVKPAGEAERDEADLVRGLAHLASGKYDAAAAALRDLAGRADAAMAKGAAPSAFALRAASLEATARVGARAYGEAAATLRRALERSGEAARRRPLALGYLALADELEKALVPDRASIFRLLGHARALKTLPPDEDDALLRRMVAHALAAPPLAAEGIERAKEALARKDDPVLRIALGRLAATAGRTAEALEAFERAAATAVAPDVVVGPPWTDVAAEALHRAARLVAAPGLGDTAPLEQAPSEDRLHVAISLLDRVIAASPAHERAIQARFERAALRSHVRDLARQAARELAEFATANEKHALAPRARIRGGEALFEVSRLTDAIDAWDAYLRLFPLDAAWPGVLERVKAARFALAERYAAVGRLAAARAAFADFIAKHPQDPRTPEAAYRVGATLRTEDADTAAVEAWRDVIARHAGTDAAAHAAFSIGEVEEAAGALERALATYRSVDRHPWAGEAARRIATITSPEVDVRVLRPFHAGEKPAATIVTRNIEKYEVTVHRVDVKDLFLKTRRTDGLLSLEVAIAAPDVKEERTVAGYAPLKPIEHAFPLPFEGPGVAIVTVRAGTREASNAVLVTDVAFLGLLTRRGARAFAVDVRRGEHVETLPLTVAVDDRIAADPAAWKDAAVHASVFAEAGGSAAFRDYDLARVAAPTEATPAHAVLTDRSIYAGGDDVQALGLVRVPVAEGGSGLAVPEKDYVLEARAPNGRPFARTESKLDADGTIALRFRLPAAFAGGQWTLVLGERKEREPAVVAQGVVTVVDDRLGTRGARGRGSELETSVDSEPEKPALGEKCRLRVTVVDGERRPVRAMRVGWRLAGELAILSGEGTTDARGAIAVDVPASLYLGRAPELGLSLPGGFEDAHTLRFEVPAPAIEARLAGLPLAPVGVARKVAVTCRPAWDLAYVVLQADGVGNLLVVADGQIPLSPAGGGEVVFTPERPGGYLVRITARDGRGLPVSTEVPFAAATPGDDRALFIQVPEARAAAGAEVEVEVTSAFDMPGFVACLTDKVESVTKVKLAKGVNRVKVRAPESRFAAFEVAAFGLRGPALDEARATLELRRGLEVKVESDRERYDGGEEARVKVRVADEAGRPAKSARLLVVAGRASGPAAPAWIFTRPWQGPYVVADGSNRTAFEAVTRVVDESALRALEQLASASSAVAPVHGIPLALNEQVFADEEALGIGEGEGGRYGGRFGGRRQLVNRQGGAAAAPRPETVLLAAFDVRTGDDGTAELKVRLPLERAGWGVQVFAVAGDRAGRGSAALTSRGTLTLIAPPAAHVGAVASAVVIGDEPVVARVEITHEAAGGRRVTDGVAEAGLAAAAAPGVERPVPFLATIPGDGRVTLIAGDRRGEATFRAVDPAAPEAPLAFAAATPFEAAEAAAAALLAARDPAARMRAARTAEQAAVELASGEGLLLGDAVALAIALAHARASGEEVDPRALAVAVDRAASLLQGKNEGDARVLRRYLLSFREELSTIQVTPYYRERDKLSARALALLVDMLRRLGREEEVAGALAALEAAVAAGRLYEKIDALDGDGVARAAVERARGRPMADGAAVERVKAAARPFEAGLFATLVGNADAPALEGARRAAPAPLGRATKRTCHLPDPVVDGRVVRPVSAGVEPAQGYEAPSLARVAAGEVSTATVTANLAAAGILEEPLPPGCRALAVPAGWAYVPSRHALVARLEKGEQTRRYVLGSVAPAAPRAPEAAGPALLAVVPHGEDFRGATVPEPAALAGLALHRFQHGDMEGTLREIARLAEKARLTGGAARDVARAGFLAAVKLGRRAEAVSHFETLKEVAPDLDITPADARFAALAYEEAGEPLAALDLYRALLDERYLEEALLPGELDRHGKSDLAIDWNERLLIGSPGTTLNRGMVAALAQRMERAGEARHAAAARTYLRYLVLFPDADDRDQVAYALASLAMRASDPATATRIAAAGLERFPKSRLKDGFRLLRAVALYAEKKYAEALAAAEEMAREDSAPGKLLKAQVLHAEGKLGPALDAYRAVADRFADARRTVAFLERSGIAVPEITIVRTDEEAAVDLEYLGVREVELKLVKIDLVRLYLRAEGEVDLKAVEVAGFKPAVEKKVALARPSGTARLKERLPLGVKEPGAYYLTARSGSFGTTGIVLITDLTVEVQTDPAHVRVYVSDVRANAAAANVKVAFIRRGGGGEIGVERTDLRGVAEAGDAYGPVTVVAEREGQVALAHVTPPAPVPTAGKAAAPAARAVDALTEELKKSEQMLQDRQGFYEGNVRQTERGIKVKQQE